MALIGWWITDDFPKVLVMPEGVANLWLLTHNPNGEVASRRRTMQESRMSHEHGENMQAKALGIWFSVGKWSQGLLQRDVWPPKFRNIFMGIQRSQYGGVNSGKLSGCNIFLPLHAEHLFLRHLKLESPMSRPCKMSSKERIVFLQWEMPTFHWRPRSTFRSFEVEKARAIRSKFRSRSQNGKSTARPDHFWMSRCWKV